jgi:hypothetical protein
MTNARLPKNLFGGQAKIQIPNCAKRVTNHKAQKLENAKLQSSNDKSMTNVKAGKTNHAQHPPLKIRGAGGVMRVGVMEVTPCYLPYSKGELGKRGVVLTFRHSDFVWPLDFDICVLPGG